MAMLEAQKNQKIAKNKALFLGVKSAILASKSHFSTDFYPEIATQRQGRVTPLKQAVNPVFSKKQKPQSKKTSKNSPKKAQILKIANSLLSAPHAMGVVVRKIYLQTLENADCVKLTQTLKNKNQKRVKGYLAQLKNLTITLAGQNIKVYKSVSYNRGKLNCQFTNQVAKELKKRAPYTLLNLSEYQAIRSKYAQALYELSAQFKHTQHIYMSVDRIKKRLACSNYAYNSQLKQKVLKPALARLEHLFAYQFTLTKYYFNLTFKPKQRYDIARHSNYFTINYHAVAI